MKKSKTDISDDVELNEAHNKKMQKIKEARDKMMSGKTKEKGLIIVHTGSGKGKSSSGFGMIMRCIAHEYTLCCRSIYQRNLENWRT